jgi:6-pyruvoyltetrahydropterin/6-carboxytetrahydropterin synthase
MEVELIKTFRFEAAHWLIGVSEDHKCRRLHGHSYRVDIHVSGPVDSQTGMVIDFTDIHKTVRPILEPLDHRLLNDIPGLTNSTSEILAKYLWDRIKPAMPLLSAVTVWESESSRCVYRGDR